MVLDHVILMPELGEVFNSLGVEVNRRTIVPSVEQNRIITTNGYYQPGRGYDVFGPITVDVTPEEHETKLVYTGYENLYKDEENINIKIIGTNLHDILLEDLPFDYMVYDFEWDIPYLNYRIDLGSGKLIVHPEQDLENEHLFFSKNGELLYEVPLEYNGLDLDLIKYTYMTIVSYEEKEGVYLFDEEDMEYDIVEDVTEIYENEAMVEVYSDYGNLKVKRHVYKLEDLYNCQLSLFEFNNPDALRGYIEENYDWSGVPYDPVYLCRFDY